MIYRKLIPYWRIGISIFKLLLYSGIARFVYIRGKRVRRTLWIYSVGLRNIGQERKA